MLIGLNCKGMEHLRYRTGRPISVPVASQKTSNGRGTDQNGFFFAVPLQRGKRPMERVPLVKIEFFFVVLWCVSFAILLLCCCVLLLLCCVGALMVLTLCNVYEFNTFKKFDG